MLLTMVPAKDIEDVEIMKHRYDGFEKEMNANASRVAVVNQLARKLLHVEHPNSEQIMAKQNQVYYIVPLPLFFVFFSHCNILSNNCFIA